MDNGSGPSSSFYSYRRPDLNGNSSLSKSGIVTPSFSSSSSSVLPASLGLGARNGVGHQSLGDRPLRLDTDGSDAADTSWGSGSGSSVSNVTARSRTSNNGSWVAPDKQQGSILESNGRLSLGSGWNGATGAVRRTPIPGLAAGAQMVEPQPAPTSSRNFLVPIGATGARQKLSIANASQRKKMIASDEVRWPAGPPSDPTFGKTAESILNNGRRPASNSTSSIPRSHSEGLINSLGPQSSSNESLQSRVGRLSSGHTPVYGTSSGSSSGPSSSSRPLFLNGTAKGLGSDPSADRSSTPIAARLASGSTSSHAEARYVNTDAKPVGSVKSNPYLSGSGKSASPDIVALPSSQRRTDRPLTSTEIVQTVGERELAKRIDPSLSSTISKPDYERRALPRPGNERNVNGGVSDEADRATEDPLTSRSAAGSVMTASPSASSHQRSLSSKSSGSLRSAVSKSTIKSMFTRGRDGSLDDSGDMGDASEPNQQDKLERDLMRSAASAAERDSLLQNSLGLGLAKAGGPHHSATDAYSHMAALKRPDSTGTVSSKAPTIDLELPSSSFFDLGDKISEASDSASRHDSRGSVTAVSDISSESFEGYMSPSDERPGTKDSFPAELMPDVQQRAVPELVSKPLPQSPPSPPHLGSSPPGTPKMASAQSMGNITPKTSSPSRSDNSPQKAAAMARSQSASSYLNMSASDESEDPLATPRRSRALESPVKPARSKARPVGVSTSSRGSFASDASSPEPSDTRTRIAALTRSSSGTPLTLSPKGSQVTMATSPEALTGSKRVESFNAAPRSSPRSLADEIEASQESFMPAVPTWQRNNEAYPSLSPEFRQSRFSEASTDASDSRTPTRTEHRLSGVSDTLEDDDILDEEKTSMDGQMLPTSAWAEVENALHRFRDRSPGSNSERGNLLRTVLLPFLALEAETASVDVVGSGPFVNGKARRALFFEWIRFLLLELQHVQTSADRGAILESIACIIESRNFSVGILNQDKEDEARFSSVFGYILSYAIGELNKKGVYQNTLIFSGRLLAVAFFRMAGVASKLLRALPVNRFALERVAQEAKWQHLRPRDFARFSSRFPESLRQLCFKDSRSYLKMLDQESVTASTETGAEDDRFLVRQPEVEVEMTGNWLRRWQSDDSELFFSFCRSYHRQLACLFASSRSLESVSKFYFGGPGYAHLATCVHQKCLALVHRVILSVTTLSSQKNFNPAGETANVLLGSTAGKPRILEAANRRCTAIVVDIVRAPSGSNMIFAPMLGLHIKCLVKRTSLYDVQGVFCLLDWLDGVLNHMDQADLLAEGLIDVSFIITTIGMLLEDADHALALMRTIAFCYANFGVLTATKENRVRFCEEILLKPKIFIKLFLSWSFTIRAYFLHLLVFRLARINDFGEPKDEPNGKTSINIARLFNKRLEEIRRRHDQLSPITDSSSDGDKSDDDKTKGTTAASFVSTIKTTPSLSGSESSSGRPKAERLLSFGSNGSGNSSNEPTSPKSDANAKGQSKAKSWLKALRGSNKGGKGGKRSGGADEAAESDDEYDVPGSMPGSPNADDDALSDVSTLDGRLMGHNQSPRSGANGFEFEITSRNKEGGNSGSGNASMAAAHDAGLSQDTAFDLQNSTTQLTSIGSKTQSPRLSKAFSKRSSILPGPASELMNLSGAEQPPVPDLPLSHVYEEALHVYAVQSLREYEQTVQEHDEFFASLPEDQQAQVPRLPVNWPAMWSSTGE